MAEIERHCADLPVLAKITTLDWVSVLSLDSDEELSAFEKWVSAIGAGERDLGEASVFAVAETRGAIALTDDKEATRVGRAGGLRIHGTIWLMVRFHRQGKLSEFEMCSIVDALRATGMRLPCTGSELPRWARNVGLL